jgi:uncharacterized protein (TIGR02246 family)
MKSRNWIACAGLGLALVAAVAVTQRAVGGEDEAGNVRKSCGAFVIGWNSHDPKAMAAVFTEDGDAINPMGQHAAGRAELEKMFTAEQTGKGPMRDSTVEVKDEPIRFLTADVAVSDAEVVLTGAYGPDGSKAGPIGVHVTNVWKKVDGKWWIEASRPYIKMAPPPSSPMTK